MAKGGRWRRKDRTQSTGASGNAEPRHRRVVLLGPDPDGFDPEIGTRDSGGERTRERGLGVLPDADAACAPTAAFDRAVRETFQRLARHVCRTFGPGASLRAFGSLVQGTHLEGSDLDLAVGLPQARDSSAKVAALRHLAGSLPAHFSVLETRLSQHIRVPIVIVAHRDPSSGVTVEADVSIGMVDGRTGVQKGFTDKLIRRVCVQAPQALPLVRLVKRWAKSHGLNQAFEGYLNSLAWTLLCLCFLVSCGRMHPDMVRSDAAHDNNSGQEDLPTLLPDAALSDVPSAADLACFFEFVANFGKCLAEKSAKLGPWGASVLSTRRLRGPAGFESPFYVEDPGVKIATGKCENVARSLRVDTWQIILSQCKSAAGLLRSRRKGSMAWVRTLEPCKHVDEASAGEENARSRKRFADAPARAPVKRRRF